MLNGSMTAGTVTAIVAGMVLFIQPAQAAADGYVEDLSCSQGPFRVRLPKSYNALRAIAPLESEAVLKTEDWEDYKTHDRRLTFAGLEVTVVTFTHRPDDYMLASAKLSNARWQITGRLRVGAAAKTALRGLAKGALPDGEVEFMGDTDSLRITISGGRIKQLAYDCYTG